MSDAMIFQACGAAVMLVAILLFWRGDHAGNNVINLGPVQFSLSAPSLVIFVIGAGLFVFPFTEWFRGSALNTQTQSSDGETVDNITSPPPSLKPKLLHVPALIGKDIDIVVEYCEVPASQIRELLDTLHGNLPKSKVSFKHVYESNIEGASILYMKGAKESDARVVWSLVKATTSFDKGWLQPGMEEGSTMMLFLTGSGCPIVPS